MDFAIQYTIVGIILIAAVFWLAVKAYRLVNKKPGKKGPSCPGCSSTDCPMKEYKK